MTSEAEFENEIDAIAARFVAASAESMLRAEALCDALPPASPPLWRSKALWARGQARSHAGRHEEGIADLQAALAACPPEQRRWRIELLRGLSIAHGQLGALDTALQWAIEALDGAGQLDDPVLLAECLMSVGVAFSRCGDAEAGLARYREVLALFESRGDVRRSVPVLNNMGINLKNLGRLDESLACFDRAVAQAHAAGDDGVVALIDSNRGETLWRLGRHDEARAALAGAVDAIHDSGYVGGETNARVTLGRVLYDMGRSDEARDELVRAVALAESSGGRNYAAQAHRTLAELHKAAGRFEAALAHHEAFHAAERAQFNEDSDRKLRALQVQHALAEARHAAEVNRLELVELAGAHRELQQLNAQLLEADREKSRLLERLAEQSRTDALTGLANRRHLDERLAAEFERARRHGHPLALAMCDIDHFKRINDRFGHAIGDEVLRRLAALLRERCRATDLTARYGGEEFCIVFIEADATLAAAACDALRVDIAAHDWRSIHPELAVTLSIGVSDLAGALDHERLLAEADTHLYRAKHQGKNRVCWGDPAAAVRAS